MFLDDDLLLEKTLLEDLYNAFKDTNHSIAYCNLKRIGMKTHIASEWNHEKLNNINYISNCSMVKAKDFPGWDETIMRLKDWDVWLTMAENGKTGIWVNKTLLTALYSEDGISSSKKGLELAKKIVRDKHNLDFNKEYYNNQKTDSGQDTGCWASQMIDAFTNYIVKYPKKSRILDLGCHTGSGMVAIKKIGYNNVVGVDLIKENIEKAKEKGLNVIQADMHNLNMFNKTYFDVLFMSHTIEHATNPLAVLEKCFKISKNGLIIIPIEPKLKKRCNPPHYYTFFDKQDVIDILEKIDCKKDIKCIEKYRLSKEIWIEYKT